MKFGRCVRALFRTLFWGLPLVLSLVAGVALASRVDDERGYEYGNGGGGSGDERPARTAGAGMSLPNTGNWGASGQKSERPEKPNVSGIPWFQELVDKAPEGSVLKPPAGTYAGPVLVNKPLVIDGSNGVTISGGGRGTVFTLETDKATMKNLRLTASGGAHDTDDACLNVRGNSNTIENLRIDDCLFGIDLKQADGNIIRRNRIASKNYELGERGDAIRLWYSKKNLVEANEIIDSRDTVAWYSDGNIFRGNIGRSSRYSLHFMFARDNVVEKNEFYDNAVGVYLMYTDGAVVRDNLISHANGAAGMAVGMKEASGAIIEGNEIIYCAVGIGSDLSPFEPGSRVVIRNNRIAYNGIGIHFLADREGHFIENNIFEGNMSHVAVAAAGTAMSNLWRGNYWDDYQGFDRNRDGFGDRPYELYAYADQIWMEIPDARFFRNSPVLEALDVLERLAPFSSPVLLLKDERPVFLNPAKAKT